MSPNDPELTPIRCVPDGMELTLDGVSIRHQPPERHRAARSRYDEAGRLTGGGWRRTAYVIEGRCGWTVGDVVVEVDTGCRIVVPEGSYGFEVLEAPCVVLEVVDLRDVTSSAHPEG